jgi:ribose-phosphate pyrophosphokinase
MNPGRIFAFPNDEWLAKSLAEHLGLPVGRVLHEAFDEVSRGDHVILVSTQTFPSPRLLPLVFLAMHALERGAERVGVVAPYLSFLRIDRPTRCGTGGTSRQTALLLSSAFDWTVSVAPQLTRVHELEALVSVPLSMVDCATEIVEWVRQHVSQPILVGPRRGPDAWSRVVSRALRSPLLNVVDDHDGTPLVELSARNAADGIDFTPVIIRSVLESPASIARLAEQLHFVGYRPPICVAVHPLIGKHAVDDLLRAGVQEVVSCTTAAHCTRQIDLTAPFAQAVKPFLASPLSPP